ncbi:uncharacterized protein LOC100821131 [Brachypodium distachyon]|uniref:Dipeptidylpeptidase IV N-terminal domain-containing protein n=1 Tax=Brachypodium distachyon TaxID=15368 RepID=I1IK20_BRADI|nr:uncharacterized protein LOC100821131 [Brachypodium distachyon]KQJ87622.1 hypothetical protein BRADI_4g12380v3 [Brachypodium distachyon]|eukprot:XP_003575792.1 uncharacterized protein LOC100821131 [Brachypodium distachyon]
MAHSGGSIAFFGTFRPLVPLDIFSLPANPQPSSAEQRLTDGISYNHNGRAIPPAPLKELLAFLAKKDPPVKCGGATPDDVDSGLVTGIVLVSERDNGLETLHVALSVKDTPTPTVLSLRDIYGHDDTFSGVRMEDSGCFAGGFTVGTRAVGHSLVYVSTKEPAKARRTPWTAVYKTSLEDGSTERLTPQYQYDINPAVSPSGKRVAVANFRFNQWTGEIDRINTDIVVMNVDRQAQGGLRRRVVIKDGGWPTWGSDNVIFFHRGKFVPGRRQPCWQVFRYDLTTNKIDAMTPENIDAMTPAAIDENKVAVAATRAPFGLQAVAPEQRTAVGQFRQIEIYEAGKPADPVVITSNKTDHYNPFLLQRGSSNTSVGFHRCRDGDAEKKFSMLKSPPTHQDVALYRGAGVFPTFTNKGSELAYVDNDFRTVYVADGGVEPRAVYKHENSNKILSVTWNQKHDTLYCCIGTAFTGGEIQIWAIYNVCDEDTNKQSWKQLTDDTKKYNNAFPSSNKEGDKLVFRSSCDRSGGDNKFKNLYIMEDATEGDSSAGKVTQLTKGDWTDTHCCWSPTDDWIVFSSSRDRAPPGTDPAILDAGCFSIFMVNYKDPSVVVRVMHSDMSLAGHVCHPVFSPDRKSIVVTSDVAAVSADPASLPIFIHSVRPYGDIFTIKLRDPDCLEKNGDIVEFDRITHSRYENSTPTWTELAADPNDLLTSSRTGHAAGPCPFLHSTAYKC